MAIKHPSTFCGNVLSISFRLIALFPKGPETAWKQKNNYTDAGNTDESQSGHWQEKHFDKVAMMYNIFKSISVIHRQPSGSAVLPFSHLHNPICIARRVRDQQASKQQIHH